MRHRKIKIVSVVIVLAVVGLLLGVSFRQAMPKYDAPREYIRVIRASHKWLESAKFFQTTDQSAVVDALLAAELIPNQEGVFSPSVEMQNSLAELISQWLAFRAEADVEGYINWMKGRGYSWALHHPDGRKHYNMKEWGIRNAWKMYTGTPDPENLAEIDPEQFFRAAFIKSLELKDGLLKPVRGSSQIQIVYQSIPISRADTRPGVLNDWEDIDKWSASAVSGDRPHWVPAITYSDVLRRDSVAFVAIVFVGLQSQRGDWVPMRIAAYYEIAENEWHIHSVAYSNSLYDGIAVEW